MNCFRSALILLVLFHSSCSQQEKTLYSENKNFNEAIEKTYKIQHPEESDLVNYIPAGSNQIRKVRSAKDKIRIEYGFSFGECKGFCKQKMEFSSEGILSTKTRWSDEMTIVEYTPINKSTYDSLMHSIQYDEFFSFKEYLGCGDCADGGSEWLIIKRASKVKRIEGTFGYQVACVQELLDYLRAI